MNSAARRGAYLALATALVSGVAVYINSFGVKQMPDALVFTTAKNLLVALALAAFALTPVVWGDLRRLSGKQWASLVALGIIGGSLPFLLFFQGLREATAPSAAFIHKTLFIWVAILAVPFLRERLGGLQIAAMAILIIGQLVLVGRPALWALGRAEVLVLLATLLWSVEAVLARKILSDISAPVAALGRMGFGSLAMLGFLAASGRSEILFAMDGVQWGWVVLTSFFLLVYVSGYYGALKNAPATLVSSVLVLGSVVTSLLHALFSARSYSLEQMLGFVLILGAVALWLHIGNRLQKNPTAPSEVVHVGR